jgi:8-oxo-dGTP pyrophosphatase MutT (NUDIX family)
MIAQMYKLFINNKTVYLVVNPIQVQNILVSDNELIIQKYEGKKEIGILLDNVLYSEHNNSDCVVFGKDPSLILNDVLSHFTCLEAAGGVVENQYGEILLIFRRGAWDLPKGKMDDGESLEETAIREVEEETGLNSPVIVRAVRYKGLLNEATYHSYLLKNKRAMKISYWFQMRTIHTGDLKPQTDEDIEQAIWVPKNKLPAYYPEMYPSIVDVLENI